MNPPRVRSQVPMLFAADLRRTISFYEKLGFRAANQVEGEGGVLQWVWLEADGASLMFARASDPIDPQAQAALLYLYASDVAAMRTHLLAQGVAAGEIATPFWAPRGEFRLTDPDGWCVMISHHG
jgi:catechol 2,3-dioxygenase-like lactoylglutathione lyase family enzyme